MQKRKTIFSFLVLLFFLLPTKQAFTQIGWGPATNLGPNVNTSGLEDGHCISADSSKLYISTDRPGGIGEADIWVSEYIGGWQVPTNLDSNVNSIYEEYEPCISSDGMKLYFSSFRPGGYGLSDIWVSEDIGGIWQPATNLGSTINSSDYEGCPFVSSDGSKLYFVSDRPGGYGDFDIWVSTNSGGSWQTPTNLGSVINTSGSEFSACLSFDGQTLYFASDRAGGFGGLDNWQSENIGDVWQPPTNLGSNINTTSDELVPIVSSNGNKLYFAAYEWPGGYGNFDIWVSEYSYSVEETTTKILVVHKLPTVINGPLHLPKNRKCNVFDITGRKVNPRQLVSGVYFIEIEGNIAKKVVKVR